MVAGASTADGVRRLNLAMTEQTHRWRIGGPPSGWDWLVDAARSGCVLGTRHGKEAVIAPVMRAELGLEVEVLSTLDTDRFGTFTREVPRRLSPLDTARAKARAALAEHRRAGLAIASEGSFGPHPQLPFAASGTELIVLLDVVNGIELIGSDVTLETNFAGQEVTSIDEARAFAATVSFPTHGVIVMAARDGRPDPSGGIVKGLVEVADLERAVDEALNANGRAWLETDMRAHLNPTRMRSIERAAQALARAALQTCPDCQRPGYIAAELLCGRVCAACGGATPLAQAEVLSCKGCGRRETRPLPDGSTPVPPDQCPECNP